MSKKGNKDNDGLDRSKDVSDQLHNETSDNVSDIPVKTSSIEQQLVSMLTKITERQEAFEKQTIQMVNKQTDAINEIQKEFSHLNKPANENIYVTDGQNHQVVKSVDQIDDEGVNWGGTRQIKKKDEFGSKEGKLLDQLGIDKEQVVPIVNKVIDSILNKNQGGNMGQIFQEFMMRDFFDNYQSSKLQNKAMMNMLVKKGFLSEIEVGQYSSNLDITNDPINQKIQSMKTQKQ